MTFGPNHYVPVLKIKRNEKAALRYIAPASIAHISPLMEVVSRNSEKTLNEHLDTTFDRLAVSLRPYARCFLDTREIESDGARAAGAVFRRATNEGIIFTPVTGISRTVDVAAALEYRSNGLALRVTKEEFERRRGRLAQDIDNFLVRNDVAADNVDLILDLGAVENLIAEGVAALTRDFTAAIPNLQRWRTFTVSGCAFPLGMGRVNRNSNLRVNREEWIAWRDYQRRDGQTRLPTYSDCGIQHPKGVEGFDFKRMAVSAVIRYTLPTEWLLIKGESTKTTPARIQFPRLARRLVSGSMSGNFAGRNHCAGCRSMQMAADNAPNLGSAGVWRRLGTIHHISVVMQTLASYYGT